MQLFFRDSWDHIRLQDIYWQDIWFYNQHIWERRSTERYDAEDDAGDQFIVVAEQAATGAVDNEWINEQGQPDVSACQEDWIDGCSVSIGI